MSKESTTVIRLNLLYGESRLTQSDFAKLCGVSASALKNYLNGDRPFPTTNVIKLCKQLSISSDWLLGLSDVRQPSANLREVCEYTGLSEESAKLLVTMKKNFRQQLAALDALLVSCLHYDREKQQYQYNPLHGVITSNAEYFRIVNETWLHSEEIILEDTVERNNARMRMMDSTMNLLEDSDKAHRLCEFYRKNLERLESEQDQKGGPDNGSGNE